MYPCPGRWVEAAAGSSQAIAPGPRHANGERGRRGVKIDEPVLARRPTFEPIVASTEFGRLLADGELPDHLPRSVLHELGERLPINVIPEAERTLLIDALMPQEPKIRGGSDETMRVATYTALLELARIHERLPRDADLFALAVEADPQVPATLALLTSIASIVLSHQGGAYQLLGMMLFCSLVGLAAALVVLRINRREGGGDPQIPVN